MKLAKPKKEKEFSLGKSEDGEAEVKVIHYESGAILISQSGENVFLYPEMVERLVKRLLPVEARWEGESIAQDLSEIKEILIPYTKGVGFSPKSQASKAIQRIDELRRVLRAGSEGIT